MNEPPNESEDDLRDARIAAVFEELVDRSRRGEPINIDRVVAEHPDIGSDIRLLWGTACIASEVGDETGEHRSSKKDKDDSNSTLAPLPLPCQFGEYELLEEVGRGGMGIVYRARHVSLDRVVAIKMLLRGCLASSEDVDRFVREARTVAQMSHPNILPIYDFGEQDGRLYFSMPFIEGETLTQRLKRSKLPSRRAAKILSAVSRAVQHAHEQGLLHRDLKPSNIMLDKEGTPFVTDFGLSRPTGDPTQLTRSGAVVGTPAFMSPEQAGGQGEQIGPASDVYSLGCVLYNAITGQPPFAARTPVELIMKVIEHEPLPPRQVDGQVSRALEMVAMRCLQKPIDLRYESAGDLADDLDAFLRNEPLSASRSRLSDIVSRMFRETHHAPILENWGGLWMLNAIALLFAALVSEYWRSAGVTNRVLYFSFWAGTLVVWATVYALCRQRLGSITFVERQIAHVWAAGLAIIFMLMPLEYLVGAELFQLAPLLAMATGVAFLVKAGSLSGTFYIQAFALFCLTFIMAVWPTYCLSLFGVVVAICFFVPGYKHYRRRKERLVLEQHDSSSSH